MSNSTKTNNKLFFILTFLLTLPAYILVGLAVNYINHESAFGFVFLSAFAPLGAALILVYRENRINGIKSLLSQTFDFKKIKRKIWFIPVFLIIPLLFLIVYALLIISGHSIPKAQFPLWALPVQFLLFFLMATGEELGWMGYAFGKLEDKFDTVKSTMLLSIFWAIWHIPFYYFLMDSLWSVIILPFCLVGLRIIMIWIFKQTNLSVFAIICLHTMYNISIGIIPVYELFEGQVLVCVFLIVLSLIILLKGHFVVKNQV